MRAPALEPIVVIYQLGIPASYRNPRDLDPASFKCPNLAPDEGVTDRRILIDQICNAHALICTRLVVLRHLPSECRQT